MIGARATCRSCFDNRGLPAKGMEWGKSQKDGRMPVYYVTGQGKGGSTQIGNVFHCEGGYVAESKAYDNEGAMIKKFEDFREGPDHMPNFIASIKAGKLVNPNLHVSNGFHAACLAHLANISYRVGKKAKPAEIEERLQGDKFASATFENFAQNLADDKIDIARRSGRARSLALLQSGHLQVRRRVRRGSQRHHCAGHLPQGLRAAGIRHGLESLATRRIDQKTPWESPGRFFVLRFLGQISADSGSGDLRESAKSADR